MSLLPSRGKNSLWTMNDIVPLVLRVTLQRLFGEFHFCKKEVELFGILTGACSRNTSFLLKITAKRAWEMQEYVLINLIDCTKTFDKERRVMLYKELSNLGLREKDFQVLWCLDRNQTTCIKADVELQCMH